MIKEFDDLPCAQPQAQTESAARATARHRIIRNSLLNLAGQGIFAVFYLGAIIILAHGLGREGVGAFFKIFVFLLVIQFFVEAGVGTVLTRRISHEPALWRQTVAEAIAVFSIMIAATLLGFIVAGSWVASWHDEAGTLLRWGFAGIACAAIQAHRFAAAVFFGFEQFAHDNIMKILQGFLFAALLAGLVGLGWGTVEGAFAVLAVSHLCGAAFMLTCLQRRGHCLGSWRLNGAVLKSWLGEGVPLGLSDSMRGVSLQLDTILLGWLQTDAVMGIYSLASRPIGPLNWLPRAVLTALFPSFVRQVNGDRAALDRTFGASIRFLWIISLPIAVGLSLCAETVVLLLGGEEFREAALPLAIVIWIVCFSYVSFQYRFLFTALNRTRLYFGLVGIVLCLQIVIDLSLIPSWSYYGACVGSLVAEFSFTMSGLVLCRFLGLRGVPWSAMACACVAAAGMAGVLWYLRDAPLPILIPAVLFSVGVYFLLCVLLGALSLDEVRNLFSSVWARSDGPGVLP